jgi:uncharacterized protein YbbC (DUF1343 family)
MTKTGLDRLLKDFPPELVGKKVGVVCHAASITSSYVHILDAITSLSRCGVTAIFGPQHGLYGQTQDNMIEWEGGGAALGKTAVYSLYGSTRKPTPAMLAGLDALLFDLQDVGARPYTYLWTLKFCMEACAEQGVQLWVLDRPNPIAAIGFDGPMIDPAFFSFVGNAQIPLCYRMTIGEVAVFLEKLYVPSCDLHMVWMDGWQRDSLFDETGLPWVLPSPNMPTLDTAIVYPGMVLFEATNLSEGRGTTRPFELFGAPYIKIAEVLKRLAASNLFGCLFREHDFQPTFQKWAGTYCHGIQIHVTDPRAFRPVETAAAILHAIAATSKTDFLFRTDPYEYEREKPAIDILTGSDLFRTMLMEGATLADFREMWRAQRRLFEERFKELTHYPEELL